MLGFVMILSLNSNGTQRAQVQMTLSVEAAAGVPDTCGICVVYDRETGETIKWPYYDPDSTVKDICGCDCEIDDDDE